MSKDLKQETLLESQDVLEQKNEETVYTKTAMIRLDEF